MPGRPDDSDRLFAALALRTGMVSQEALDATERELAHSDSSFGRVLQERGVISEASRQLLEGLVQQKLALHSGDSTKSLATLNLSDNLPPTAAPHNSLAGDETADFDAANHLPVVHATNSHPHLADDNADRTQWTLSPTPVKIDERYTVVRSHAKGGMGVVSVARDNELNREVAFKELQEYCADDSNSRARFVLEAEITGKLEHPGVVPIYGLGAYPDGRPYYAMRFVQGDSLGKQIAAFHAQQLGVHDFSRTSLAFRALLGRFVDVCNAIAYAHSRGILHRDIKPDNVMLGKYGETLVVDWGLAKAMRGKSIAPTDEPLIEAISGDGSAATRMGSATGTPAYMSPEQAMGQLDRLGPASDVYSLGATLYCLLTGHAPIEGKSVTEVLRKAQNGEYQPPKTVNPRVPPALNSICCHSMAIKPEARYPSPLDLAADIENWLSDEAVTAHTENQAERAARWFRRHRAWALAGAAALALVTVVTVFAAIEINQRRREAIAERQKAIVLANENEQLAVQERAAKQHATARLRDARETVDTWLTGFSEALSHYPGVQKFRERMLLRAAEDYERFVEIEETDREMKSERGRAMLRLGDVRRELLQLDQAEKAYEGAQAIFELASSDQKEPAAPGVDLQQTLLRRAILAAERGKIEPALKFYRNSIDVGKSILAAKAGEPLAQVVLADATSRLGTLLATQGKVDEARALLQQSADQLDAEVAQLPDNAELAVALSNTRIALGQILFQRGEIQGARQNFEQASRQYQSLIEQHDDNPTYLESRARALINLAATHRVAGHWDLETEAYHQAIEDYQRLIRAMPDVPVYRENLSLTQNDLGQLLRESFQSHEAIAALTEARYAVARLAAEFPSVIRFHEEQATCSDNLGQALLDVGQYSEALAMHKEAEDVFGQLVANVPEIVQYRERHAISRSHLGVAYHALQQFDLAKKEFQSAIESLEAYVAQHDESDTALKSLAATNQFFGDLLHAAEESEAAASAYAQSKQHWSQLIERSPQADYFHGAALFHTMCPDKSIREPGLAVRFAGLAIETAPTNALYQGTLAAAHYRNGKFPLAASLASEALRNTGGNRGRDYLVLAMAELQQGETAQADESLAAAAKWRREFAPGNITLGRLEAEASQLRQDLDRSAQTP